ncbi:hypothetical protein ES703_122601 [subsurface metagenome]
MGSRLKNTKGFLRRASRPPLIVEAISTTQDKFFTSGTTEAIGLVVQFTAVSKAYISATSAGTSRGTPKGETKSILGRASISVTAVLQSLRRKGLLSPVEGSSKNGTISAVP